MPRSRLGPVVINGDQTAELHPEDLEIQHPLVVNHDQTANLPPEDLETQHPMKTCHILVKLEHRAYWVINKLKYELDKVRKERKLQLCEFQESRKKMYESARLCKEKTKALHDKVLCRKEFHPAMLLLLFESKLKLFSRKLESRWMSPLNVIQVHEHGAIDVEDEK
ncbi:hypothetical protein Dsin_031130 [Dipteronia sinensis]|uniref:Uncharacterized protein n=1 Tax=Dipteronia sinensis TaxID=43782 RepID=A0AAE0DS26_9ROSI|nr:hypothetical protein Dsin_031130 [Dipteronia sinensis]